MHSRYMAEGRALLVLISRCPARMSEYLPQPVISSLKSAYPRSVVLISDTETPRRKNVVNATG